MTPGMTPGVPPSGVTGADAARAYLGWLAEERRASPLTVEAYARDIAGLLGFLTGHLGAEPGLDALGGLTQADLRAWLAAGAEEGAGNATRARRLSAVRGLFRYLARRHGLDNPAPALLGRPRARPPLPRALTVEQAGAVVADIGAATDTAASQARDTALFTLLYGCGLRIAEALALDVRDAPLPGSDHGLVVRGKGGKQREVPVLPVVRAAIAEWLARHPDRRPESPLFLGVRGGRLDPAVAQRTMRGFRRRAID